MSNLLFYVQRRRLLTVVVAVLVSIFSLSASADAKLIEAVSIDGPGTGAVNQVHDVALSPDGKSGGIVYLKQEGGKDSVFFAPIVDGKPGSPKRIDVGQANDSFTPSVTASNSGKIGVYWRNTGKAYYAGSTDSGTAFSAPTQIGTKANVNTLYADANADGIIYVSLGSDNDVHAYRIEGGAVAAVNSEGILDNDPAKDAGSLATSEESRVATTPNGNAYLVWSEGGTQEAYVRYLTGTASGSAKRLDDGFPFRGHAESANPTSRQTRVRVNGAGVATAVFINFIDHAGVDMPRTIARTVTPDGTLGPMIAADGLGDVPDNVGKGVELPGQFVNQVGFAQNAAGNGLLGVYRQFGKYLVATQLTNGVFSEPFTRSPEEILATGPAVAIGSETDKGFYVWSTAPMMGNKQIFLREATPNSFDPNATQISKDDFGDTGNVMFAAADRFGNGVIAFQQGTDRVVFSALDQPPSTPEFTTADGIQLEAGAGKIEWKAANEDWGSVNYSVKIDGKQIASGTQTAVTIPADTTPGNHTLTVEAVDRENQSSPAASRQFVVKAKTNPVTPISLKSTSFKKGVLSIVITNQSSTTAKLVVSLKSKSKLRIKVKKRKTRRIVTFGLRRVSVDPGKTITVKIKLSKTNLKLLRTLRKITAIAKIDVVGQPASQSVQKQLILRAPKRK